ncbi:unnamed protein product [Heterobilharzia americana]|nr:unnamed protein product [Heterobilharzia americana]
MCPQLGITAQEHPRFRRLHSNFGLITCFTLSICSAAYMYKMLDEIISDFDAEVDDLAENTDEKRSRLNSSELKAVLDQRGVLYSSLLERRDVEFAVNSTGLITSSELKTAEAKQLELVNMNFSNSPDAFLYRKLINPVHQSLNSNRLSSSFTPISIIFDSESEFIEHVEDKKDSVWLLAVASPRSVENGDRIPSKIKPTSVVSEEVWAVLNHRYQSFGFKMGLLNCKKLHSLCIDRGFINPDLILALPKGGERMKDMVQFRPLPKEPKSKINADKKSSKYILDGIHSWIVSVLAERVKVLKDVRSIYPVSSVDQTMKNHYLKHLWSSWLSKRPQPIHVLWFPELSSKSKLAHPYQPPLVLSALSVTYTGRVRFWSVPNDLINQEYRTFTANADNWPVTTSYITTVHNLLTSLNCPNKCHFLILTPEGRCYPFGLNKKEFLSYENLEILLRSLYPSADDFLLMLLFITSLLVFINGAIEAGRISFILTHSFSENNRNNNLPERNYSNNRPSVTRRSALARTVIRLARQGWTSHVPSFIIDHHSMYNRSNDNSYRSTNHNHWNPEDQLNISPSQQPINMKLLILSHILEWIKIFLLDLVSACILLC